MAVAQSLSQLRDLPLHTYPFSQAHSQGPTPSSTPVSRSRFSFFCIPSSLTLTSFRHTLVSSSNVLLSPYTLLTHSKDLSPPSLNFVSLIRPSSFLTHSCLTLGISLSTHIVLSHNQGSPPHMFLSLLIVPFLPHLLSHCKGPYSPSHTPLSLSLFYFSLTHTPASP